MANDEGRDLQVRLRLVVDELRRETHQAIEEWDHAKAAGIRRAIELIEEALGDFDPGTIEEITKGGRANE